MSAFGISAAKFLLKDLKILKETEKVAKVSEGLLSQSVRCDLKMLKNLEYLNQPIDMIVKSGKPVGLTAEVFQSGVKKLDKLNQPIDMMATSAKSTRLTADVFQTKVKNFDEINQQNGMIIKSGKLVKSDKPTSLSDDFSWLSENELNAPIDML